MWTLIPEYVETDQWRVLEPNETVLEGDESRALSWSLNVFSYQIPGYEYRRKIVPEPQTQWRLLNGGEVIQEGDEVWSHNGWVKYLSPGNKLPTISVPFRRKIV